MGELIEGYIMSISFFGNSLELKNPITYITNSQLLFGTRVLNVLNSYVCQTLSPKERMVEVVCKM